MKASKTRQRILAAMVRWDKDHALAECLAGPAECNGGVIKAHSIQNAVILESLADHGEVFMFRHDKSTLLKLQRIGRKRASVFTGFCQYHDTRLFREIDFGASVRFDPASDRQRCLLALRAASRTYWAKYNQMLFNTSALRLCRESRIGALQELLNLDTNDAASWAKYALVRIPPRLLGVQRAKARLERTYKSLLHQATIGKYHLFDNLVLSIDSKPVAAAAEVFNPEFDLLGRRIGTTQLNEDVADVACSVFYLAGKTWCTMSYHRRFKDKLLGWRNQFEGMHPTLFGDVLAKLLVIHFENAAFSPMRIDKMPPSEVATMEQVFRTTINGAVPYTSVPHLHLFDGYT